MSYLSLRKAIIDDNKKLQKLQAHSGWILYTPAPLKNAWQINIWKGERKERRAREEGTEGKNHPFTVTILVRSLSINEVEVVQSCLTLYDPWTIQSMEFSRPDTGGSLFSRENFQTQGSNPGLPIPQILYCSLSHKGSPFVYYV